MKGRLASSTAWIIWLSTVGFALASILLSRHNYDDWAYRVFVEDLAFVILVGIVVVATSGAMIASRIPRNPIGWIFCLTGLIFASTTFINPYLEAFRPSSVPLETPLGVFVGLLNNTGSIIVVPFVFLFFPTGHLPSPRWRPLVWVTGALILLTAIHNVFATETLWNGGDSGIDIANPLRIDAVADVLDPVAPLGLLVLAVVAIGSIASLVQRFRRSSGIERLQIKWFSLSGLLALISAVSVIVLEFIPGLSDTPLSDAIIFFGLLFNLTVVVPLTVTIAILRYRLWDIDRIINRTLVYTALSASLLSVYLILVVVFGGVVRATVGGSSSLVTAASTLAVAALFRPLRARIQQMVDQRFYRRKYDAVNTLETFSARLRDELDLQALASELHNVIDETMQPAHVSLWLRPRP